MTTSTEDQALREDFKAKSIFSEDLEELIESYCDGVYVNCMREDGFFKVLLCGKSSKSYSIKDNGDFNRYECESIKTGDQTFTGDRYIDTIRSIHSHELIAYLDDFEINENGACRVVEEIIEDLSK